MELGAWVCATTSSFHARCNISNCDIAVNNAGVQALRAHARTVKHVVSMFVYFLSHLLQTNGARVFENVF